ncbi:hypothetical protein D3C74_285070 [compost metagenome]
MSQARAFDRQIEPFLINRKRRRISARLEPFGMHVVDELGDRLFKGQSAFRLKTAIQIEIVIPLRLQMLRYVIDHCVHGLRSSIAIMRVEGVITHRHVAVPLHMRLPLVIDGAVFLQAMLVIVIIPEEKQIGGHRCSAMTSPPVVQGKFGQRTVRNFRFAELLAAFPILDGGRTANKAMFILVIKYRRDPMADPVEVVPRQLLAGEAVGSVLAFAEIVDRRDPEIEIVRIRRRKDLLRIARPDLDPLRVHGRQLLHGQPVRPLHLHVSEHV